MISETEGFGLTWKRQDADPSRRDLMLGGCPDEGLVVYTR
jgi:hypothetical protein